MTVEPSVVPIRGGMFQPPVYRSGRGEPLLWLHGGGGMARGFTADLEALAASYEVIAPVHPGWDETPGLEHLDDVHDMGVYLQDLVDTLGLTSFYLAGHSTGGMFAAELAAARPDLVKKLVLIAPAGLWIDETPVTDFFAMPPEELGGMLFGDLSNPAIQDFLKPPDSTEALARAMYLRLANFSAAAKYLWPIPDKGLKRRIHRIKAPTLILWGDRDRLIPPAYASLFHRKIARSQVATIKGAGHMVSLEKTPEFVAEVRAFLG